ncbi:MAG: glycosyltransferase family 4 protein [Thermotogota bacterium]|nr:glycosyltransferase family 4 protein [Thermotogota bacterium]
MPKKILYITSVGLHWGSEKSLFLLVNHINRNKFSPFVLTVSGSLQRELKKNNIPYSIYNSQTLTKKEIIKFISLVFRLVSFIKKEKFNLIHTNDIHSAQYSVLAARLAGVPSVLHIRNTDLAGWLGWKNKLIFKIASKIIAISRKVKESLLEIGVAADKIQVIPNAVDLDEFNLDISGKPYRDEIGVADGEFLIGVVGRITPHKGQDIFIQAIPDILNFFPNAKFTIIGEDTTSNGDFIIQLQQLAAELKLETKVYFSAFKANVPQIMKALDVLVVPSLSEPFGRVVIEAMAAKTPVVASRVGGIPDIIKDGVNGILVPLKNPKAISEAVIRLLSDKDLYYNICQNGRKTVEELFSIPKHVEKVEKLYQSLV